jgi:uncharacterized membrane protein YdjX (TVP38/TMEM64 family)
MWCGGSAEALGRLNRSISEQKVLTITAFRMVPVAPYSLINLAAGAEGVPFRDFVVGTSLGRSPGVVGITFPQQTILNPSTTNLIVLCETLVFVLSGILGLHRWSPVSKSQRKEKFCGWRQPKHLAELR